MTTLSSNPPIDSDDQRLQFHLQLMGRLPSRAESPAQSDLLPPLQPPHHPLRRQSTAPTCGFIDPLDTLTADPSPYHHAMPTQSIHLPTRPSSRSSNLSASLLSVPTLPFYSPTLSTRSSTQSVEPFDPDYEAERVRLAKLEQRRSMGLGATRPNNKSSRASSASSIASVHSFRSVRASRSKVPSPPFGVAAAVPSVYRPSPLRSTSTPDLGVTETEAEKQKKRKEMKEEYEKMRAARIEEEKRSQQLQRDKSSSQDPHQRWFTSRFKRPKANLPTQPTHTGARIDERRSTSQSSATDSIAHSSLAFDHGPHSVTTVPTSEEETTQVIDLLQKCEESSDNSNPTEQLISYDSPAVDPFRKSILPGQVPPTPTKIALMSSATPKSKPILAPARSNLNKLNRLFDNLKLGGSLHSANDLENCTDLKRKTHISVLQSNTPSHDIHSQRPSDQLGWLDSLRSMRTRNRTSRRKTLAGMFLAEKDSSLPPPLPELAPQISS